jgi:NAD(P)-dependent dehydrogenase (short-subunit alcohol dehydrogenase family)
LDLNLKGKTALVTGGGSGLGRAITEEFAREGVNVTVSYRSKEKETKAFLEELNSRYGTRSIAVKADISNKQDLSSLFDTACETFGKLDILVIMRESGSPLTSKTCRKKILKRHSRWIWKRRFCSVKKW